MTPLLKILVAVGAVFACGSFLGKPKSSKAEKVATKSKTDKASSKKHETSKVLTRKAKESKKVTTKATESKKTKTKAKKAVVSVTLEAKDLKALWEGRDFPEQKLPLKDMERSDIKLDKGSTRNVHIFGLQGSGTSLLRTLLYANLGRRLTYFDSEVATTTEPNKSPGLWTHSNIKELARSERDAIKELTDANVYTLAVVRNPYSWLQTMRSGPSLRCLADCTSGDDWLVKPCIHNSPGGPDSTIQRMEYQSMAGLWNHWNEGYAKAAQFGFQQSMVVTFEDLVTNPEAILDQVTTFLDLKKPSEWIIPFDGAERDEQFDIEVSRKFMNNFIQKEKQQACVHLDPDVLQMLDYKVFECQDFTSGKSRGFGTGQAVYEMEATEDESLPEHVGARPLAPGERPSGMAEAEESDEQQVLKRGPQKMQFDDNGPKPLFASTFTSKVAESPAEETSQDEIA